MAKRGMTREGGRVRLAIVRKAGSGEHTAGIEHVSWQIAMGRLQNIAGNWAKMQKKREWKQFGLFSQWIICPVNRFESGTKLNSQLADK